MDRRFPSINALVRRSWIADLAADAGTVDRSDLRGQQAARDEQGHPSGNKWCASGAKVAWNEAWSRPSPGVASDKVLLWAERSDEYVGRSVIVCWLILRRCEFVCVLRATVSDHERRTLAERTGRPRKLLTCCSTTIAFQRGKTKAMTKNTMTTMTRTKTTMATARVDLGAPRQQLLVLLFMCLPAMASAFSVIKTTMRTTPLTASPVDLSLADYSSSPAATGATAELPPPVLLLHGLLGSKRNFSTLGKALSTQLDRKRRVLALDLRNHGAYSFRWLCFVAIQLLTGCTDSRRSF